MNLILLQLGDSDRDGKTAHVLAQKKIERLRALFRFAQNRKWLRENPASGLKSPKVTLCPTLPYTREDMMKILAAIEKYADEMPAAGLQNARSDASAYTSPSLQRNENR
jgi:hypothetical protein